MRSSITVWCFNLVSIVARYLLTLDAISLINPKFLDFFLSTGIRVFFNK